MIPYAQKVVSDFLRPRLAVRVVAHPPAEGDRDEPWIQVTQLDAPQAPNDPADRLVEFYFQFDCYAGADGGMPEAERISRTLRDHLHLMPGQHDAPTVDDDAVVVSCVTIIGASSQPDTDAFEPARDRFVVTASVYAHSVAVPA